MQQLYQNLAIKLLLAARYTTIDVVYYSSSKRFSFGVW